MNPKQRYEGLDGVDLLRKLRDAEDEDDWNEIMNMSDAELDKYIDDNGGDSKAIRERGKKHGEELSKQLEAREWQDEAAAKSAALVREFEESRKRVSLSRKEMLDRLLAAKNDRRFASPVAAFFHEKTEEGCTDEELRSMVDQLEFLAFLDARRRGKV